MANELFKGLSFSHEDNNVPVAIVVPSEQEVVVGSVAKLDGRSSLDPNGDGLTYAWTFKQVPIGSQVAQFGFTNLETDASIVSFAPDITGIYRIELVVSDGSLDSEPTEAIVEVRVILVPHHQGYVPDASFIWNYLSDFWTLVPDRRRFEVMWSAMIQLVASEMLKLYQYQYNRSIRDIQDVIQKRWNPFSPSLVLDRDLTTFVLSEDIAGSLASTYVLDPDTGLPAADQPTYSNIITAPKSEVDFTRTRFGVTTAVGRLLTLAERTFTLGRFSPTFQSINYGVDGATSGTDVFTGSQFSSDMVGATLRVVGPASSALLGDYVIEAYTSPTQVTIENPPSGITWAGSSNLEYTVLPATAGHTSFIADQEQVPAAVEAQYWRMGSTIISEEFDFEAQGVSAGDLVEVEVTRLDLQVSSSFFVQVTGVDRNRLSFVFNLEDLIDGTAAEGLTNDIQVTLAADLIVPGISADINGELTYALQAETVYNTVTSTKFKRENYEKTIKTTDELNLGAFSVTARPVRIIRNRKMAIDETIVSIPVLQEYIRQPDVVNDGAKTFFVINDVKTEVSRAPYLLSENLDYVIDDEGTVSGVCQTTQGIDEVTIPYGDLIDRSVAEGDTLEITHGTTVETYDIRRVVAADKLRVSPTPTITSTSALFTITRRVAGKFIRFIDGTFSKTSPAPERLWSEVTYFDNSEAIEGNFGVLVGVRREDLSGVGSGIPYKSAVAGLMYALSRGPTISNLTLSAQILLGLPFAQNAGVIKEINPGFRKREDGSPLYGRILIEGRDRNDLPTGVTNIYFYPHGRQIFNSVTGEWESAIPEFSGIAINPDTDAEYAVGDEVSQFAPLSRGVEIQEYLATPDWQDQLIAQGNIAAQLQKYHSFQVLVNSDLVTSTDIDLVAQFLKKAKAHYVRLTSALLKSFEDTVEIEDVLLFGRILSFYESPDLGAPTAPKYGQNDDSGSYLSIDGVFYARYLSGTDLVTTQGSSNVTSAAGGFVDARPALLEEWDSPLLRVGDLLQIKEGSNVGQYFITAVGSDNQVTLNLDGAVLQTGTAQVFAAFRPIKNPIWTGKVTVTTGDGTIATQETVGTAAGIGSAGVSVGDYLVFGDLSTLNPPVGRLYTIVEVVPDPVSPHLVIIPDPVETTAEYDAWVVREGLITSGHIDPPGSSGEEFFIDAVAGLPVIDFVDSGGDINSWLNLPLLQQGSVIRIDDVPYEVIRFESSARRAIVTPPLLASYTNKEAEIDLRPERPATPASVDFLDRIPADSLELTIVSSLTTGDDAQTVTGSTDVTLSVETFTDLAVGAGDFLVLLEGGDSSVDVGHGVGVFPIREIIGGTTARLVDALTDTGSFRYALRRNVPHEG